MGCACAGNGAWGEPGLDWGINVGGREDQGGVGLERGRHEEGDVVSKRIGRCVRC